MVLKHGSSARHPQEPAVISTNQKPVGACLPPWEWLSNVPVRRVRWASWALYEVISFLEGYT
jgi:hypothetical protein